jgi:hypothetical protein
MQVGLGGLMELLEREEMAAGATAQMTQ